MEKRLQICLMVNPYINQIATKNDIVIPVVIRQLNMVIMNHLMSETANQEPLIQQTRMAITDCHADTILL